MNYLNSISLLKIAGINKYICIDVHSAFIKFSCVKRREPFYKIKNGNKHDELDIIAASIYKGSDLIIIEQVVKDLILKYSFSDAVIIIGIGDFKYNTLAIPADIEDIDGWFSDNRNKFLPEGRPADEFSFSYELYKQDENTKTYFVLIARSDYINSVYKICASTGLKVISLFPFVFSAYNSFEENKNTLLLDIEEDKIKYLYKSAGDNLIYQENYFNTYQANPGNNNSDDEKSININNLNQIISDIKQSITLSSNSQNSDENLSIYIICSHENYNTITSLLRKHFDKSEIYPKSSYENIPYALSLFAVKKVINNYDASINLLDSNITDISRENIEKQTAFRMILVFGATLLALLLFVYICENYITGKLEEQEVSYLNSEAKVKNIEELRKDNSYLKNNLKLLTGLKGKRVEYSNLLFDITNTINHGSCLNSMKLAENSGKYILVEFTGISESQKCLAEFISNMEKSQKFKDIFLVYSTLLEESRQSMPAELQGKNYIAFKMTAGYYADSQ